VQCIRNAAAVELVIKLVDHCCIALLLFTAVITSIDVAATTTNTTVVLYCEQVLEHEGIKFWCYNAGHVLGAAMFMIEIAGVHVLYTGDYSMEVQTLQCIEHVQLQRTALDVVGVSLVHTAHTQLYV
jgi:Cft2 family RNA processing exonuclease